MGFFWFLITVVLLILWLNERSSAKSKVSRAYDDGYASGYWEFRKHIDKLVSAGKLTKANRRDLVGKENLQEATPYESSDAADVLYEDESGAGAVIFQTESTASQAQEAAVQQIVVPSQTPAAAPLLTEKEIEEAKERRTLQNLNALLYVGSFLIVAAAALFVTLTMPAAIKLVSVIFITVAFYTTGIILHATSERLRPAAIAFVGTGLAILPFVGLALHSLAGMSGQAAWLAISAVGLLAYGVAAVRLQSQLVSYLTMAFVLSLALSTVATLGLAIVWYFIVTIGVATVCGALHYLRPGLLPAIFTQPVEQTSVVATPITLIASFFTFQHMNITMYEVLYGLATAHYLLAWLQKRLPVYEVVVRGLAHATLLIVAFDIVGGYQASSERLWLNIAWVGIAAAQVIYSLVRVGSGNRGIEGSWVGMMIGLVVLNLPMWLFLEHAAWGVSVELLLIAAMALGAMWRFCQAGWGYCALVSSVLLPFVVGRGAIEPAVSFDVIAIVFAMLAATMLAVTERVKSAGRSASLVLLATSAVVAYIVSMLLSGVLHGESMTLGWTTLIASVVFVLLSYLHRTFMVEVVAAGFLVVSVNAWVKWSGLPGDWEWLVTILLSSGLLAGIAYVHHTFAERDRRNALAITGAVVFGLLALVQNSNTYPVGEVATASLVVAGFGMLALRVQLLTRDTVLGKLGLVAYLTYPVLALATAFSAGLGWLTLVLVVLTIVSWVASVLEKTPVMLGVGNVLFVFMLNSLWSWLGFDESWRFYGIVWLAATVNYVAYWYYLGREDRDRLQISLVSVLLLLGVGTVLHLFGSSVWGFAAAGSLLAAAGVLAMHGVIYKQQIVVEVAVYAATLALQRMTGLLLPDTNMVLYAHWWAIVIAIMGIRRGDYLRRMVVALAYVTGSTGLFALAGEPGYTLLFLIEHLVLLVVGGLLRVQWAMWWGIVSVVVAILYFLRDYTALALLFLGFVIILIVIWRLLAVGKKK